MKDTCTDYKTGSVNSVIEPMKAVRISVITRMISGFYREVDQNCAFLGYYVASTGNFLPTFRDYLTVPISGI